MRFSSFAAVFTAVLVLAGFSAAFADAGSAAVPAGPVVVVRSAPDALLLWDASALVSTTVDANTSGQQGLSVVEAGAMEIAARYAPTLTQAKSVTVQVVYSKTAYVNPTFPTAVYAGTVRLLSLTSSVADAIANGAAFSDRLRRGSIPDAVKIVVQDALPAPRPLPSPT